MIPPLTPYTIALLVWGEEAATPLDDELLDQLQEEHVAYIRSLASSGKIVVCGPFADQPDPRMRGAAIFRTSIEEAMELLRLDPAVRAGRLSVQAMTWWVEQGQLP